MGHSSVLGESVMGFRSSQMILREAPGAYDPATGLWVPGTRSHFSVFASVQPMTADDMKTLPEGRRSEGMVKMYTSTQLRAVHVQLTSTDKPGQPDRLVWQNNVYELAFEDPYRSNVINHYRYRFRLLGPIVVPLPDVGSIWDSGGSVWDGGASPWDAPTP